MAYYYVEIYRTRDSAPRRRELSSPTLSDAKQEAEGYASDIQVDDGRVDLFYSGWPGPDARLLKNVHGLLWRD